MLVEHYITALEQGIVEPDSAQLQAVNLLQQTYDSLSVKNEKAFLNRVRGYINSGKSRSPLQGVYLWGDVGRGKTWLMDQFYNNAPCNNKLRMHYNQFMVFMHDELRKISEQENPIDVVVRKLADQYCLLCLDEFQVTDVGDAMILYELMKGLSNYGITLITTSNRHPDELYKGGVEREKFLPAIELLKSLTCVYHLNGENDYRTSQDSKTGVYFYPHNINSDRMFDEQFLHLAKGEVSTDSELTIQGRKIPVRKVARNIVWFEFRDICDGPRATSDYVNIAERYSNIIISAIPLLTEDCEHLARRFINMIDEFYDRRIRLYLSADTLIEKLYLGDRLKFEFQRTISRINEMQDTACLPTTISAENVTSY